MSHPAALQDFWADSDRFHEERPDPCFDEWSVSPNWCRCFRGHIEQLRPLSESGNDNAKYAIASIYLFGMIYPDEETEIERSPVDQLVMTELLASAAKNGMAIAFDNLATWGIGEVADVAREAIKEHEQENKADWSAEHELPVYTSQWMAGAMKLWQIRIGEQDGRSGRSEPV
ncbi:MAG: hypothetical protein ACI8UO_003759 [Verrucomicrobiales bacterium]|jgi:hypothetical protein